MATIQEKTWKPPAGTSGQQRQRGDLSTVDYAQNKAHDNFNIAVLPVLVACFLWHMATLWRLDVDSDAITSLSLRRESHGSTAWLATWWMFNIYILVDTLWVCLYPRSVASPRLIILHHLVAIVGWQSVSFWSGWEFYLSTALCVEINTFFLIAKRRFRSWNVLNTLDNITWTITRLIMFPIVTYNAFSVFHFLSRTKYGTYWHHGLFNAMTGVLLMCLNIKWSWDKIGNVLKSNNKVKGL